MTKKPINHVIFHRKMKIDNTIKFGQKIIFDDYSVGLLAMVTFYYVMLLIMFQVLVGIGSMVIVFLLPEIDTDTYALIYLVASETLLILILSRLGMKRFQKQLNDPNRDNIPFKESQLEILFSISAIVAVGLCFLMGLNNLSFQIVLIVFDGFALLFIVLFVLIRFLATMEIRISSIFSIFLTALSFWSILRTLRI